MQTKTATKKAKATGPAAVNIDGLTKTEAAAFHKKWNLEVARLTTRREAYLNGIKALTKRFPDLTAGAGTAGAQKAASHAGGGVMGATKGAGKPAGAGGR